MKTFTYKFKEDEPNRISFDYSPAADEKLDTAQEAESSTLYMNRSGMLTLARILIKLAEGEYKKGFHVHLPKDFNADFPDKLVIVLSSDDELSLS
jgi:hypothetical protein